jgi:hypothetical protein
MKKTDDNIAQDLIDLQISHIEALDRRATQGKTQQYYENAMISRASVFRNQLFAQVGNFFESFEVSISVHGQEISGSCSCGNARKICKHTITLLYSWVNDRQDFLNIEQSLREIRNLDKDRLAEIIINILRHNPQYVDLFLSKRALEWDEIEDKMF